MPVTIGVLAAVIWLGIGVTVMAKSSGRGSHSDEKNNGIDCPNDYASPGREHPRHPDHPEHPGHPGHPGHPHHP